MIRHKHEGWSLLALLLILVACMTTCSETRAAEPRAHLIREVPATHGGFFCYYSNGEVYGPVRSCAPYLW